MQSSCFTPGLRGLRGPTGPPGPGFDPSQPLFSLSSQSLTGSSGPLPLTVGSDLIFASSTLDISVEPGSVIVTIDAPGTIIGSTGPTGQAGPQGDTGPQGPQGLPGTASNTGAQGERGDTGPQGDTGPTGQQGLPGTASNTGAQGERGDTGPQGQDGATGPQGETGPQGPQGLPGTASNTGAQGERGATGPQGQDGATGPQGQDGATGPQGQDGATGPQGQDGATGPQGQDGATGPQGDTGPTGATGNISSIIGDVEGINNNDIINTTVIALQGNTLNASSPSDGQALVFNGSEWIAQELFERISAPTAIDPEIVTTYLEIPGLYNLSDSNITGQNKQIINEVLTQLWGPIGTNDSFNAVVFTFAYDSVNNILYAGGTFTSPASPGNYVAKIEQPNDPSSTWAPVGTNASSFNNSVRALAYDSVNNILYAGGTFTSPASPGNRLARIEQPNDPSSTWVSVGTNATFNSGVNALAYDSVNNILYAGGFFISPGNRVAKIEQPNVATSTWVQVGTNPTFNGAVNALAYDSGNNILYAGGTFIDPGTIVARIEEPNVPTSTWVEVGTNATFNVNGAVNSLAYDSASNILYAGGNFTTPVSPGNYVAQIVLGVVRVTANSLIDSIYNTIEFNTIDASIVLNWKGGRWVILSQKAVTLS